MVQHKKGKWYMKLKTLAIAFLSTVVSLSSLVADTFWTAGSESETKYWDDAANWNAGGGNYVVNMSGNPETEINFRTSGFDSFGTGFWVENKLSGVVTFKSDSSDCGLNMTGSGSMHVGGWGNPGALVIDGGTYHFADDLLVGYDRNVGSMTLKDGRVEVAYWLPMGAGGNIPADQTSEMIVEGGELIVGWRSGAYADNARIEIPRTDGKKASFLQKGGLVSVHGSGGRSLSICEGANSTGTFTISNGTFVARSENVVVANGSGSTGTLNLHGGTLKAPAITAGSGTSVINFDGGTFTPTAIGDALPANDKLTVNLGAHGGVIDAKMSASVSSPFAGTGTLSKRGAGLVTINGTVADGTVSVEEGAVAIPEGATINTVRLGAGTSLYIKGENATSGKTVEELKALVNVQNWDIAESASVSAVGERGADAETPIETTWILPAGGAGLYDDPSNWSRGVPTAIDRAVFVSDAEVCTSGDNNGRSMSGLEVRNGATVWFHTIQQGNYPQFNFSSITGDGTVGFNRCGFAPLQNGDELVIPSSVTLAFANDTASTAGNDSWIQSSPGSVVVNGDVLVKNYLLIWTGVTFNGTVVMENGSRINGNGAAVVLGENFRLVVPEGSTATVNGSWNNNTSVFNKEGAGTLVANHTGYGNLVMKDGVARLQSNEGPWTYFSFQGGALQLAYAMEWFDELVNRINSSTAHTEAIKLDTQLDVTLNTALGNGNTTNGFVKLGPNTLTLTSQPAYTGDTEVREGVLEIPVGATLPGELSVGEGAKIKLTVDPVVWMAGYTGTLFEYGTLAEGLVLGVGNIEVAGLSGEIGIAFDFTESGKVKATVTGEQLVWKGADQTNWVGEYTWKSSADGSDKLYAAGYDVVFNASEIDEGVLATNTVVVNQDVAPGYVFAAVPAGKGYRLAGESVEASGLTKSGAGVFILANEQFHSSGAATVSEGELVLEGATFSAGADISNSGVIRASGDAVSTITRHVTGEGSVAIDENASLCLADQDLDQDVTGTGTLLVTNGWLTLVRLRSLSNFRGNIRLAQGGTVYEKTEFNNDLRNGNVYPLGQNSTIIFAGGTLDGFYLNNNTVITSPFVMENGTTSRLNNTHQRSGAGNNMWVYSTLSGGGNLRFQSNGRTTYLYGDASAFTGEIELFGGLFRFQNEVAGGANSTWKFASAQTYDIYNAWNTTIHFGALNAPESGTQIWVNNGGAIVEIGNKADSVINGYFGGSEFTLSKVGSTSLVVNGNSPSANVVVSAGAFGGTGTFKSLNFSIGTKVVFGDLSDKKLVYDGPKSLSEPVWAKEPDIVQPEGIRGRWKLGVRKDSVQPEEGEAYDVWILTATYSKPGFALSLR